MLLYRACRADFWITLLNESGFLSYMINNPLNVEPSKFKPFDVFSLNYHIENDTKGAYAVTRFTDNVGRIYHTRPRTKDTPFERVLSRLLGDAVTTVGSYRLLDKSTLQVMITEPILFKDNSRIEPGIFTIRYDQGELKRLDSELPANESEKSFASIEDILRVK